MAGLNRRRRQPMQVEKVNKVRLLFFQVSSKKGCKQLVIIFRLNDIWLPPHGNPSMVEPGNEDPFEPVTVEAFMVMKFLPGGITGKDRHLMTEPLQHLGGFKSKNFCPGTMVR
jgi:hypothetical protein